jgi:ABC-type polysaccharide/polyol phosphate transport system ATPase subunit
MSSIELSNVSVVYTRMTDRNLSFKHALLTAFDKRRRELPRICEALSGISLSIDAGQRVGLIGRNGAGKSTLLRVIAGIYPPSAGSVVVKGRMTSLLDLAVGVDMDMTGWQNIRIRLMLLGYRGMDMDRRVEAAGEFSELGEFLEMPIRTYSTGMFVRLAFSVCTVIDPEILVLDEFLGAGDLGFVNKAESKMNELMSKGSIVVVASHNLASIRKLCGSCIWLANGKIARMGEANAVIDAYEANVALVAAA